jgi:hypothetical protein
MRWARIFNALEIIDWEDLVNGHFYLVSDFFIQVLARILVCCKACNEAADFFEFIWPYCLTINQRVHIMFEL